MKLTTTNRILTAILTILIAIFMIWFLAGFFSPEASAGPMTCEQFYHDYDCHWTDNDGNRHKTTEYCWNDGRCQIEQVY